MSKSNIQYVVYVGSCRFHQDLSREERCGLLAAPGLGPLCQKITEEDRPDEEKPATEVRQSLQSPSAATDRTFLGDPQTENLFQ